MFIVQCALAAAGVAAVVVAYAAARKHATREWTGEALTIAGLVAIALGALTLLGGYASRGTTLGLAASTGRPLAERTRLGASDVIASYKATLRFAVIGAILVGVGVLVDPRT